MELGVGAAIQARSVSRIGMGGLPHPDHWQPDTPRAQRHRVKHDTWMLDATGRSSIRYPEGYPRRVRFGPAQAAVSWAIIEPLDIAAEAVRGQVGEVEGLYRHRCQDLHGPFATVDLRHQRTERLIAFGFNAAGWRIIGTPDPVHG